MKTNFIYRWHVCNLSVEQVMNLTGRARRTVLAWDAGRKIPAPIAQLMAHAAGLRPPSMHPDWSGYQFRGQWLITPQGEHFGEPEVAAAIYYWRSKNKL